MLTLSKISAVAFPWVCQLQGNIGQQLHRFSLSAVCRYEDFLDKEFAKAQRDLDTDALDNPGTLLQKLERDQKRRFQATRRARTARLFQPPPEPRSITWDTIEQIRFLKQENGYEWTTEKLAASFDISKALVIKVLKSKFVPTEKALRKQDERAKVNAGLLPDKTGTATRRTGKETALLSNVGASLFKKPLSNVKHTDKTFPVREPSHYLNQPQTISGQKSGGKFPLKEEQMSKGAEHRKPSNRTPKVHAHQSQHSRADGRTDYLDASNDLDSASRSDMSSDSRSRLSKGHKAGRHARYSTEIQMEELDEPGMEFARDEEELDINMEDLQSYYDETPPPRIIRKGNKFFDENGEFLYRL